ncbi:hypothetical protein AA313_de0200593 [Arthrobotrys entomopaga]|nr:hypothetical protein AA313_de0200593 [Arthrobotrys entomopaga]
MQPSALGDAWGVNHPTRICPVQCRLWTPNGHDAVGSWFYESATIVPDNAPYLTGRGIRRHLWEARGTHGTAGFAVNKTRLRGLLPYL